MDGLTQRTRFSLSMAGVAVLLLALALQLALSVRRESPAWDEADHIFAGYRSWTHSDFGLNPEHPPLVKLLATAPLLRMPLWLPEVQNRTFKVEAFLGGKAFLFGNDARAITFRARMAAALLTLLLAVLVFLATREMFGIGPAFVVLILLAFEPNVLAHGARVTTDVGLTCFLFATVYAFYRYVQSPSLWRLSLVGVAAGLALSAKHAGVLVFPTLALLAIGELSRRPGTENGKAEASSIGARAVRLGSALVAVGVIAIAVLWAFYGFRYAARPDALQLNPTLEEDLLLLGPFERPLLSTVAAWRVLPESYIFGLAELRLSANVFHTYLLGTVFPHGVWFYFPVTFAIKSTLGFLALLAVTIAALARGKMRNSREIVFLALPPSLYLLVAMTANMNIGVRHILPLYAFLSALIASVVWNLASRDRRWAYTIAALLLAHVLSSTRAFPTYIAYSNELWGGPSNTHRYLTDSNVDWGQQLEATKQYLDEHNIGECWFAYFAQGALDPHFYRISSRPLPTANTLGLGEWFEVPPVIEGTVLVSASLLSGVEFGPGALNPYHVFQTAHPIAVIDHGVFVFEGRFEVPLASALGHIQRASVLLGQGRPNAALEEAQIAAVLAPDSVRVHVTLGNVLMALQRPDEARRVFETALAVARRVEPEFQEEWIDVLERRLASFGPPR